MGYSNDVYSSPENFDLEIVHMLADDSLSYEFDMLGVWLHKPSGLLYWAQDSGCSCPSPFEDYRSLKDLGEPLSTENYQAFEAAVKEFTTSLYHEGSHVAETDKAAVLHDVKTRLGLYA